MQFEAHNGTLFDSQTIIDGKENHLHGDLNMDYFSEEHDRRRDQTLLMAIRGKDMRNTTNQHGMIRFGEKF
ncbi:hypothetical protein MKX01_032441 [Papaver californicum]|nr:hypothetical protein MKX01_032441 [Papaver californicum]